MLFFRIFRLEMVFFIEFSGKILEEHHDLQTIPICHFSTMYSSILNLRNSATVIVDSRKIINFYNYNHKFKHL